MTKYKEENRVCFSHGPWVCVGTACRMCLYVSGCFSVQKEYGGWGEARIECLNALELESYVCSYNDACDFGGRAERGGVRNNEFDMIDGPVCPG